MSSSPRSYSSQTRQRQADQTRTRILDAAQSLIGESGFDGTTIAAIAAAAEVSVPTVYASFGSKRGIVAELLDHVRFGPNYQTLVDLASAAPDALTRLGFAARICREVYESEHATLELLRGAGALSPELADRMREREEGRREKQRGSLTELFDQGRLRPGLDAAMAADLLWTLTSRDVYRLLVVDSKWPPQRYEDWLGEAILRELLVQPT
jgi:AcrR family transcriptional regulator